MSVSDKITVKVDDTDREIFLSFGLLNELTTIINDPARVAAISLDPELRTNVLNSVLATRRKNGKLEAPADVSDLDISIEDVEKLLEWASEHIMSFFVRSLRLVDKVSQQHQREVEGLVSSLAGSKNSASKKA